MQVYKALVDGVAEAAVKQLKNVELSENPAEVCPDSHSLGAREGSIFNGWTSEQSFMYCSTATLHACKSPHWHIPGLVKPQHQPTSRAVSYSNATNT